jgi:ABC-type proline/glycine betaine transport system ATPase subunit
MSNSEISDALRRVAGAVRPAVLVLMGVSGSGKSTIALELHRLLGWPFQEGDDLHSPENVAKMRSGRPRRCRPAALARGNRALDRCPPRSE